jgi:eukaryotic-like serine/threonine-protein kinase
MTECEACQAILVRTDWGELCAACTLLAGISDERPLIGDYERCHLLGEGAMSAVYLAKHVDSDDVVALKLAKPELLARPGGLALFRQQAKTERALQHPHILQVQGVGSHEGRPFIVMPLMEGGTLAEAENIARFESPSARLELLITLARAVQFAHARGILHCDLKPENILFDADGEPRVSDFGMARQLGETGVSEVGGVRGGTRGWMSPEQVRVCMSPEQVRGESLTTASDVFALGVLLHWLGAGELPFGNGEDFEERVLHESAPPLRSWTPELAWGLHAIAWRALRKSADERYGSAAALVEDLERLKSERPLRGAPVPFWGRAWYWAQRHTGARNAIFALLPVFAALTLSMAASQRDELRQSVLDMNAYAARGEAAAVLYQLKEYADIVEQAAADPAVQALTHGPNRVPTPLPIAAGPSPCQLQTALEDPAAMAAYARKFSTLFVLDADGCARARISEEPMPPDYVRTWYDWHDYFSKALARAPQPDHSTHVRAAYRSSISQLIKFAVSTALFENGKWVGVITGSKIAASTLGPPRTKRSDTSDQMTVLIGPFEGEPLDKRKAGAPSGFTFLVHPSLARGQKVMLEPTLSEELTRQFGAPADARQFELVTAPLFQRKEYRDPLLGDHWLAAFAPVGGTGYVVLVQTREALAIRPSNSLNRIALALTGFTLGLLLIYGYFWLWRRNRERAR